MVARGARRGARRYGAARADRRARRARRRLPRRPADARSPARPARARRRCSHSSPGSTARAGEVASLGTRLAELDRAGARRAPPRARRVRRRRIRRSTPFLSARENVELALALRGLAADEAHRARRRCARGGRPRASGRAAGRAPLRRRAPARRDRPGARRRAATLLLADEPTARLDEANALAVGALFARAAPASTARRSSARRTTRSWSSRPTRAAAALVRGRRRSAWRSTMIRTTSPGSSVCQSKSRSSRLTIPWSRRKSRIHAMSRRPERGGRRGRPGNRGSFASGSASGPRRVRRASRTRRGRWTNASAVLHEHDLARVEVVERLRRVSR